MSKEKLQIKIVLEGIIAIICFVASFFVGTDNYLNFIMLGIGLLWVIAIVLNIMQWRKLSTKK